MLATLFMMSSSQTTHVPCCGKKNLECPVFFYTYHCARNHSQEAVLVPSNRKFNQKPSKVDSTLKGLGYITVNKPAVSMI